MKNNTSKKKISLATKFYLIRLKSNAKELRFNYQIPFGIYAAIMKLRYEDTKEYVEFLMGVCEHALRVRGYYKKYPEIEKEFNKEFKVNLEKFKSGQ